jgi:hypothetical protein
MLALRWIEALALRLSLRRQTAPIEGAASLVMLDFMPRSGLIPRRDILIPHLCFSAADLLELELLLIAQGMQSYLWRAVQAHGQEACANANRGISGHGAMSP